MGAETYSLVTWSADFDLNTLLRARTLIWIDAREKHKCTCTSQEEKHPFWHLGASKVGLGVEIRQVSFYHLRVGLRGNVEVVKPFYIRVGPPVSISLAFWRSGNWNEE